MKKILFFCIITFILLSFSMEEETKALQLFKAIESDDTYAAGKLIFFSFLQIDFNKVWKYKDKKRSLLGFAKELENKKIEAQISWAIKMREFLMAVEAGHINTVKKLLVDKEIYPIDLKNYEGNTALMIAVKNRNINMVQELLLSKASTSKRNNKGQTALMLAIISNNFEMVAMLLNNTLYPIENIDQRDNEDNTPFLLAMQTHNKDIIEAILPEVPDPFIENKTKETAANFAISPEEKKLLALAQDRFKLYQAIDRGLPKDDIEKLITSDTLLKNRPLLKL